jgi:hypothetical protein
MDRSTELASSLPKISSGGFHPRVSLQLGPIAASASYCTIYCKGLAAGGVFLFWLSRGARRCLNTRARAPGLSQVASGSWRPWRVVEATHQDAHHRNQIPFLRIMDEHRDLCREETISRRSVAVPSATEIGLQCRRCIDRSSGRDLRTTDQNLFEGAESGCVGRPRSTAAIESMAVPKRRQCSGFPTAQAVRLLLHRRLPTSWSMAMFPPLVRFRVYSGSLLTRTLPRAEAIAC